MGGRSKARALVWLAFAGQAVFVASWIVAGALEPHYTHVLQGVSELAARNAAHPWIVTVGIAVLAASLIALGLALAQVLPRRAALPAALFVAAGIATACTAAFPLDCGLGADHHCRALWHAGRLSWHEDAHLWADLAAQLLLLLTPFALARALWPGTAGAVALSAGASGLTTVAVLFAAGSAHGSAGGLIQRAGLTVLHLWILIVGVGVLHATRGAPRAGRLIPMRPREFFASSWTGTAELVLRPLWLGRLFRQTGAATRTATWISDEVWRIDDETRFPGGRSERRRMYCEFVSDDHVQLTGGDLPDGADVWLEQGGFRLPEWRMAWPIGPLPVLVRCRDLSYFEPDGTFVNVIDVRGLGIPMPLAQVTFRMRAVTASAPAAHGERAVEVT